jgi:uncharacterized protein (TIGR03437 family)
VTSGSRYEFAGWGDSNEIQRAIAVDADLKRVTARYQPAHRLIVTAQPAGAARITYEPDSNDGFYREATAVTVKMEARPGFRFRRWNGDLDGTFPQQILALTGPREATGLFDIVPFADPAGVQNAAGKTPLPGVAPGSMAAITGANLASSMETGPANPLAQTLGGLVVRIGTRLLPLFFAGPDRIEFQVPSDLEPAAYRLSIQRSGQPDTEASMEVVPNNPGLFSRDDIPVPGRPALAVAIRANGSRITPADPARREEEITLLATGCGAYDLRIPDGFALPAEPAYRLVDPVEVLVADRVFTPTFAGGHGTLVGVNAIRFKVPDLPPGVSEVRLRVGGRESNPVSLPIE